MSVGNIVWVDIDKIHANNYNPNVMDQEKFEALVEFCESHGAEELDPLWLRNDGNGQFEIIDGEHRWKAVKKVGWVRLRAFVTDKDVDSAKVLNVRKNRERGLLDAFKLGEVFNSETEKGLSCKDVAKKYGFASKGNVSEYIQIYKQKEDITKAFETSNEPLPNRMSFYKAQRILRELKREEREEQQEPEDPFKTIPEVPVKTKQPTNKGQQLERFLTNYAKALKNNPTPKVKNDDVQTAISFFKKLLTTKKIYCLTCGENHLQWRCGHEF